MNMLKSPYDEFGKKLLARYSEFDSYFEPASMVYAPSEESEGSPQQIQQVYQNFVTRIQKLQQENISIHHNMSMLTEVLEKHYHINKSAEAAVPATKTEIHHVVTEQMKELRQELPVTLNRYFQENKEQITQVIMQTVGEQANKGQASRAQLQPIVDAMATQIIQSHKMSPHAADALAKQVTVILEETLRKQNDLSIVTRSEKEILRKELLQQDTLQQEQIQQLQRQQEQIEQKQIQQEQVQQKQQPKQIQQQQREILEKQTQQELSQQKQLQQIQIQQEILQQEQIQQKQQQQSPSQQQDLPSKTLQSEQSREMAKTSKAHQNHTYPEHIDINNSQTHTIQNNLTGGDTYQVMSVEQLFQTAVEQTLNVLQSQRTTERSSRREIPRKPEKSRGIYKGILQKNNPDRLLQKSSFDPQITQIMELYHLSETQAREWSGELFYSLGKGSEAEAVQEGQRFRITNPQQFIEQTTSHGQEGRRKASMELAGERQDTRTAIHETNLHQTDLHQTNLYQTNIDQTNLQQRDIHQTKLEQTKLHQTDIDKVHLHQADVSKVHLLQTDIHKTYLQTQAEQTDNGQRPKQSDTGRDKVYHTDIQKEHLTQQDIHKTNLIQTDSNQTNLYQQDLHRTKLHQTDISQTRILQTDVSRIHRVENVTEGRVEQASEAATIERIVEKVQQTRHLQDAAPRDMVTTSKKFAESIAQKASQALNERTSSKQHPDHPESYPSEQSGTPLPLTHTASRRSEAEGGVTDRMTPVVREDGPQLVYSAQQEQAKAPDAPKAPEIVSQQKVSQETEPETEIQIIKEAKKVIRQEQTAQKQTFNGRLTPQEEKTIEKQVSEYVERHLEEKVNRITSVVYRRIEDKLKVERGRRGLI